MNGENTYGNNAAEKVLHSFEMVFWTISIGGIFSANIDKFDWLISWKCHVVDAILNLFLTYWQAIVMRSVPPQLTWTAMNLRSSDRHVWTRALWSSDSQENHDMYLVLRAITLLIVMILCVILKGQWCSIYSFDLGFFCSKGWTRTRL